MKPSLLPSTSAGSDHETSKSLSTSVQYGPLKPTKALMFAPPIVIVETFLLAPLVRMTSWVGPSSKATLPLRVMIPKRSISKNPWARIRGDFMLRYTGSPPVLTSKPSGSIFPSPSRSASCAASSAVASPPSRAAASAISITPRLSPVSSVFRMPNSVS